MSTNTYTVADIHCGSCERMIRTMIGEVEGVDGVKADHQTNQVVVSYDETLVAESAIAEALANTGFAPV